MAETILKKMVTINGAEYTITSDGKVYGKGYVSVTYAVKNKY